MKSHHSLVRLFRPILSIILVIFFVGCVGSALGGKKNTSESTAPSPAKPVVHRSSALLSGVFIDSPVSGLSYLTLLSGGLTGDSGAFKYQKGEIISFFVGKLSLGSSVGKPVLTPIDIVPGAVNAKDQRVVNICVLLQTLDSDGNLNNGIQISKAAADTVSLYANKIKFNKRPSAFYKDANIKALMVALNKAPSAYADHVRKPRKLRRAQEAQAHLLRSLSKIHQEVK